MQLKLTKLAAFTLLLGFCFSTMVSSCADKKAKTEEPKKEEKKLDTADNKPVSPGG